MQTNDYTYDKPFMVVGLCILLAAGLLVAFLLVVNTLENKAATYCTEKGLIENTPPYEQCISRYIKRDGVL